MIETKDDHTISEFFSQNFFILNWRINEISFLSSKQAFQIIKRLLIRYVIWINFIKKNN